MRAARSNSSTSTGCRTRRTWPPRQERALTADERRVLVHKPYILKSMYGPDGVDRIEKRRIEKQREKEEARRKRFQHMMTTRKDVMGIIDLYNQHKIIPLAARLDEMEKVVTYMALPLWRRRWLRLKRLGDGVLAWLERRGIRLYTVDTRSEGILPIAEGENDEAANHDRGGARGGFGCAPRGASCVDDGGAHTNGLPGPGVHSRARRSGPQQPHGEGALRGHISRGA